MELFNLGVESFNNSRFDPSAAAGAINRRQNPAVENFADIYERAKAEQQQTEAVPSFEPRSTPVVSAVSAKMPVDKSDQLYHLCLELENFVVKIIVSGMRNTVQKTGLIDDSFAGKIYEDMLWDEYAKDFTKNANFGLAEQAYRQLNQYLV